MTEATTVAEITNQKPATLLKAAEPKAIIRHDSEKWLKFFLNNKQIAFMRKLREAAITAPIGTHASIDVGVVTGKNEFFVLSRRTGHRAGTEWPHRTPRVAIRTTQGLAPPQS